ncbi:probable LRR receptor-like serine/threonine-protein kinase At4g37250 [Lotus japonicus]|uniref:probable LRR receptor-like serine/threonine-protein kinase At4g37250 n=1 Tax=Lotus japonicus TaxID=34305 RepID=UPI002587913C|nr:probable LRR receptor-like serine/threonine-protein kinase At4g37250 [Lotus japonicus]
MRRSNSTSSLSYPWWKNVLALVLLILATINQCCGLNRDGVLLLSFKYSILNDALFVLRTWNYSDETPCSWNGVACSPIQTTTNGTEFRVTSLSLPNSQLLGSLPSDLGSIDHLQILNLANNSLNGSLPSSLFQSSSELQLLNLYNNLITGEVPESIVELRNLQILNLSDNALTGKVPENLSNMQNLTVASLRNNYLSGFLPHGLQNLQVLDLSSNLLNGTLPPDFGGDAVRYLNISYNRFSGKIPPEFAAKIPTNATVDLSFNNFTGEVPDSPVFLNQETESFTGNIDLCGEPTRNVCPIPSSPSSEPKPSPTSPPAIAAIPKTFDSPPLSPTGSTSSQQKQSGLRRGTIIGIVIGDVIGIGILAMVFIYVYKLKRKKSLNSAIKNEAAIARSESSSTTSESKGFTRWSCLRKRAEEEESSETPCSSDGEAEPPRDGSADNNQNQKPLQENKTGTLVTVDGEKQLEVETLLKASAFILGATGSSIMYKAVLEDGTSLAVRRIGESGVERFKDFENTVRVIAKLVHPNLVRVRGFYWGHDEKLIIYDFVPNGCLANVRYRKVGSSPSHLPWEIRLKIAKGVARGLTYLHEKKHVHGNLKPSNILLGNDMEPKIGDFGLERIVTGDTSYKAGGSARIFGSKRSTASRDSFQDVTFGPSPSPSPSSISGVSPYSAPESLRNLKPHPKWDVYSFGVLFLELLTGKVVVLDDMSQAGPGLLVEDQNRALRMVDVTIRADMEGKEEALLAYFKLGYSCVCGVPQKRPQMKEVLQILEKTPSSSPSSFSYYYSH